VTLRDMSCEVCGDMRATAKGMAPHTADPAGSPHTASCAATEGFGEQSTFAAMSTCRGLLPRPMDILSIGIAIKLFDSQRGLSPVNRIVPATSRRAR
jgi:hypothetical protein